MGFCFPGLDKRGADLPPRRECAPTWQEKVTLAMPQIELVLLIGMYAQKHYLRDAAYGSLTVGLDAKPGQSLLIRGGTSSVGMATAVLAGRLGMTVLSTTRSEAQADALRAIGVDHVVVDDGAVAPKVRAIEPDGVHAALELIGTPTLPDTLAATRVHGVVCFTGMLSNQWIVKDFYPIEYLPRGVRLTAYGGDASDLPSVVLQDFLAAVAAGNAVVPIHRTYTLDEIVDAHREMEAGTATGKLVVTTT